MIDQRDVLKVKKCLEDSIGRQVILTTKKGRKKIMISYGTIESIYPSVFIVRLQPASSNEAERRVSYSYTDILTKSVELVLRKTSEEKVSLCG